MNEWINVKEKLPKEGELVLAWRESNTIPDTYYPSTGAYGFFREGIWGNEEKDDWNVTHWMELPKAPK